MPSNSCTSIRRFLRDESGAITFDWVVLTAAFIGLGLSVLSVVRGGMDDLSVRIDDAPPTVVAEQTY